MIEIHDLENYRTENGLSKADMARIFGVVPQAYNNWVYRNSLPKDQIEKAARLIGIWKKEVAINSLDDYLLAHNPTNQAGGVIQKADVYELKRNYITENEVLEIAKKYTHVPLISWVQAGNFCESPDLFSPGDAEEWLTCPSRHSQFTYALKVFGDSMTSSNPGERSYPHGTIIFVDPERAHVVGSRVIARLPNSSEVTFKLYTEDAGQPYLMPINQRYPAISMPEDTVICGVVVGSYWPE